GDHLDRVGRKGPCLPAAAEGMRRARCGASDRGRGPALRWNPIRPTLQEAAQVHASRFGCLGPQVAFRRKGRTRRAWLGKALLRCGNSLPTSPSHAALKPPGRRGSIGLSLAIRRGALAAPTGGAMGEGSWRFVAATTLALAFACSQGEVKTVSSPDSGS